jgi:hypothetical protein
MKECFYAVFFMLRVANKPFKLSVIMLSDILLSVVAPMLEYSKLPSTQRHLAVTVKIYTWMFFIFPKLCLIRPLLYLIFTYRSLKCSVPLRIAFTWLRFRIWLMHFIWKKNIIKFLKIHQLNAKLSTEIGHVNEPLDIGSIEIMVTIFYLV